MQRIPGPSECDVEHAQPITKFLRLQVTIRGRDLGEQRLEVLCHAGIHLHHQAGVRIPLRRDHAHPLGGHGVVEFGKNHHIELETLGSVDRHHLNRGRGGILHGLAGYVPGKVTRTQRGLFVPPVPEFHELQQTPHLLRVAPECKILDPSGEGGSVSIRNELSADPIGQGPRRALVPVTTVPDHIPQWRASHVIPGGSAEGVIGEVEEREQGVDRRRIRQGRAPFAAGIHAKGVQSVHQVAQDLVAPHQHADAPAGHLLVKVPHYLCRATDEVGLDGGGPFILRSEMDAHMTGQLLRRLEFREVLHPVRSHSRAHIDVRKGRVGREVLEHIGHEVEQHRTRTPGPVHRVPGQAVALAHLMYQFRTRSSPSVDGLLGIRHDDPGTLFQMP